MRKPIKFIIIAASTVLLITTIATTWLLKPWEQQVKEIEPGNEAPIVTAGNNNFVYDPNDYSYGRAEGEVYTSSQNEKLSFTFPPEWVNKYVVTEKEDLILIRQMTAADLHPEDDQYGTLFSIRLFHSEEEWRKEESSLENVFAVYKIGAEKKIHAVFQLPETAGVKAADGFEITTQYQKLTRDINWLMYKNKEYGFSEVYYAELVQSEDMIYYEYQYPQILSIEKGGKIEMKPGDAGYPSEAFYTSPNGETIKIVWFNRNSIGEGLFSFEFWNGMKANAVIVIDGEGAVLTNAKYNHIETYAEGLSLCATGRSADEGWMPVWDGKYGFLNNKGEEVISLQYDEAWGFSDGLAYAANGNKEFFINTNGEKVFDLNYNMIFITGERHNYQFTEGLLPVSDGVAWDGSKMGYIDKTGKVVIGFNWGCALPFSGGAAPVAQPGGEWSGSGEGSGYMGKWGLIDKTGKLIVPTQYGSIRSVDKGLFRVSSYVTDDGSSYNHGVGLIDITGKLLLPIEYDYIQIIQSEHGNTLKCTKSYQNFEYYVYENGALNKTTVNVVTE